MATPDNHRLTRTHMGAYPMDRDASVLAAKCTGKDPLTAGTARKVAKRMKRKGGSFRTISAYHCPFCREWHVGARSDNRIRRS